MQFHTGFQASFFLLGYTILFAAVVIFQMFLNILLSQASAVLSQVTLICCSHSRQIHNLHGYKPLSACGYLTMYGASLVSPVSLPRNVVP
jgi:hypothetical protein